MTCFPRGHARGAGKASAGKRCRKQLRGTAPRRAGEARLTVLRSVSAGAGGQESGGSRWEPVSPPDTVADRGWFDAVGSIPI